MSHRKLLQLFTCAFTNLKQRKISLTATTSTSLFVRQFSSTSGNMSATPTLKLCQGVNMPVLGYGTWQAKDDELERAIEAALEAGYRHIDTAYVYENEKVVGRVLKRWFTSGKLKREDIFLVTKLPPGGNRPESLEKYLNRSLESLQVDYVDLYLIHVPFAVRDDDNDLHPTRPDGCMDIDCSNDHVATWKVMEAQMDAGKTRSIGISNFNKKQIERILQNSRIKPCSLQIELHAYLQQNELVDFCKKNNIVVTAYSPLGSPAIGKFMANFGRQMEVPDILHNPVVEKIAANHKKTPAQVLLRHITQKGIVAIPKSTNPGRLRENLNIFDFELDQSEMKQMNALDKGIRLLDFKMFKGVENHPEYPFN